MKKVDLLSFDAVKESEQGFDLAIKNADGTDSGVVLIVLGKYAQQVTDWTKAEFNKMQREAEMAKRKGKDAEPKSLDELRAFSINSALVRVTGWKNVTQEFSQELLRNALDRNPHWIEQITEASDEAANFTKPA